MPDPLKLGLMYLIVIIAVFIHSVRVPVVQQGHEEGHPGPS